MSDARRTPPWLDLSQPLNDKPRTQNCGRCRGPLLVALVGNPCGLTVHADARPLNLAEELTARQAGRTTYCLRLHRYLPPRLLNRGAEHIASGNCTHLVVADHHCTARTTSTPAPAEPHPANRLF